MARLREMSRSRRVEEEAMYDVSSRFLNQLAVDRRDSLHRSGATARQATSLRRAGAAVVARIRPIPHEERAPAPAGSSSGLLTRREQEVVMLVADGLTNAQIAESLCISPGTVRRHLENVFSKLGVNTRTAAVARLREG
jgi:DNA-binding NarL/FixJ family response regulator